MKICKKCKKELKEKTTDKEEYHEIQVGNNPPDTYCIECYSVTY